MDKKKYISPAISVIPMDYEGVLAGSAGTELGIGVKNGEEYTEAPDCTNKKQWDELSGMQKGIWK